MCSAEAAAVVSEKGTAMFCANHSTGATEKRDGGDKKEDRIIDQCCGITSRNKRCKITKSDVGYNWFCSIHEKQRTHDDNRLVEEAAEGDGTIIAEGCLLYYMHVYSDNPHIFSNLPAGIYMSRIEEFRRRTKFEVVRCNYVNKTSTCRCATKFLVKVSGMSASEQLCWAHNFVPKEKVSTLKDLPIDGKSDSKMDSSRAQSVITHHEKGFPLKDASSPGTDPQKSIVPGKLDSKLASMSLKGAPTAG